MVNPLSHFEQMAVNVFERALPRMLGGQIDASELAVAIARAIESDPDRRVPPRRIDIVLNPEDLDALENRRADIETELSRRATRLLVDRWAGARPPLMRLVSDSALDRRAARAEFFDSLTPPKPLLQVGARIWNGMASIALVNLPLTIGRALDNLLVVDSADVSRYHAQIRSSPEGLTLVDLESTNGTFVNGDRVRVSAPLHDGDAIVLGKYPLRVTS